MAYLDREEEYRQKANKLAFDKLINSLKEYKREDGTVDFDKLNALYYIEELQKSLFKKDKELEEYKKFFDLLSKFLPNNTHTIFG